MQGRHEYQPKLFTTFRFEDLIPKSHLLKRVDSLLDFSFIRELTAPFYCKNNGRPSIDPELFLRMILVGYLYNIRSDRQLCEEIGLNLAYRWFCRLNLEDKVPDHSSLTRIRDRFGEKVFEEIFKRIVKICIDKGLVKSGSVMVDATFIEADASLNSLKRKDGTKNEPPPPPTTSGSDEDPNDRRRNRILGEKISNQTHQSASDPDSTITAPKGKMGKLGYKAHVTIDSESRVILDCHVSTGAPHETKFFIPRIEATEASHEIQIEEVIADRGYGAGYNMEYLKERGMRSFIPVWSTRVGKPHPEGFVYDREKDQIICPEGHAMKPYRNRAPAEQKVYHLSYPLCSQCPRFQTCVEPASVRLGKGKLLRRHKHEDFFEEAIRMARTQEYRDRRTLRFWKQEGVFAEAKNRHCLRRAKYRGLAKVQIQTYLTTTVQNLKRLLQALGDSFQNFWAIFLAKIQKPSEFPSFP